MFLSLLFLTTVAEPSPGASSPHTVPCPTRVQIMGGLKKNLNHHVHTVVGGSDAAGPAQGTSRALLALLKRV